MNMNILHKIAKRTAYDWIFLTYCIERHQKDRIPLRTAIANFIEQYDPPYKEDALVQKYYDLSRDFRELPKLVTE